MIRAPEKTVVDFLADMVGKKPQIVFVVVVVVPLILYIFVGLFSPAPK